jgi:hypothetical protein
MNAEPGKTASGIGSVPVLFVVSRRNCGAACNSRVKFSGASRCQNRIAKLRTRARGPLVADPGRDATSTAVSHSASADR